MPVPAYFAPIALLVIGASAMAQPLEPEQTTLLESAREAAIRYTESLPDFICTEVIHRTEDPRGSGRWHPVDTLTIKLSYFGRKEDYRLMLVNGKPTTLDYLHAGGALSTGEFGTRLLSLFHPKSHAEFHWKGWTNLRKRRAARFSYRVARENSIFLIQYGAISESSNSIVVAYHGDVVVDEQTHMILRMSQEGEIPAGFPISYNASTVDYEFAPVGGKLYLLPSSASVRTRSGRFEAENNVEFRDYRKFQTETNINFGPGEP
jgi:hypothetical protein